MNLELLGRMLWITALWSFMPGLRAYESRAIRSAFRPIIGIHVIRPNHRRLCAKLGWLMKGAHVHSQRVVHCTEYTVKSPGYHRRVIQFNECSKNLEVLKLMKIKFKNELNLW